MIDAYLRELGARLPAIRRRRLLAEAEAHLRDDAARRREAGATPQEAEAGAVGAFGPADVVAARAAGELAAAAARPVALLVLVAAVLFVVPVYAIPENTLPPAPWQTMPDGLAWLRDAAVALWLAAVACAAGGALLRAPAISAAALACLATSAVAGVALTVRWDVEAPATPVTTLLALTTPLAAAAVVLPAAALVYLRRLRAHAA